MSTKKKSWISTITEIKLDSFFTTAKFLIDGVSKSFRFHRNGNGGGTLFCVGEDIASRELKVIIF